MKKLLVFFALLFIGMAVQAQENGVAINENNLPADSSAILDVSSTTQGMLVPRMTTAQRTAPGTAIGDNPAEGLLVYDTDLNSFMVFNGLAWQSVGGATGTTQFTPANSADPNGSVGDMTRDDNYLYIKTAAGWKRSALTTF
ncbi:MAG: hypothetical protein AAGB22_04870 [Bacteroidota bacterium]